MDPNDLSDDDLDRLVLQAARSSRHAAEVSKPWEIALIEAVPRGTRFTADESAQWERLVLAGLNRLDRRGYTLETMAREDLDDLVAAMRPQVADPSLESPLLRMLCRLAKAGLVAVNVGECSAFITDKGRTFLLQKAD